MYEQEPGLDVCELCGGEGRTTMIAIRSYLGAGKSFDLQTLVDLSETDAQKPVMQYMDDNQVLVVVMSPNCRSVGPPSNLNKHLNPGTWQRRFDEEKPHLKFCCEVAEHQFLRGRSYLLEQPHPSRLFSYFQWPRRMKQGWAKQVVFDQCRVGLHDGHGVPVKKPTVMTSNSFELLRPFSNLRCRGDHQHADMWSGAHGKLNN